MDGVFAWVAANGYGAIFLLLMLGVVGLPVPDETLLVFCGYLITRGVMHPAGALVSAVAGSWCGITLSYCIGRFLGAGAVHRYGKYIHLTEERMALVHRWFDRIGHWALFVGYYIAGVRHLTAVVAGTSGLEFRSFARDVNSSSAALKASTERDSTSLMDHCSMNEAAKGGTRSTMATTIASAARP